MRLLISNLNQFTTVPQLVTLFIPFGWVSSARLMMNTGDGRSACAAMLEMEQVAGQIAIHELDSLRFMDHYIQVEDVDLMP